MSNFESWLAQIDQGGGSQAIFAELYRQLLDDSLEQGASAIHLHFAKNELRLRYRIDGKLSSRCAVPLHAAESLFWAIKTHARMDVFEWRWPHEGRGTHRTESGDRSIRVAIAPASRGPSVVLQWIEEDSKCHRLHELGLLAVQESQLRELLQRRLGFIVVGCSGFSGRRTLGHAMLLAAKQAGKEVLSLEWGVSRRLPHISQCDFNERSRLSQLQWIQAALRHRPEVIFIEHPGRDTTIGPVIAAARNSCLVIAAMGRPFEYLIDWLEFLDVPRRVSTTTLLGVVEQRLIPRLCPDCLVTYCPKASELRELKIRCDNPGELTFAKSSGCESCRGTGRLGQVGVHEISMMTDTLRDMFVKRKPDESIRQHVLDSGISTFHESAVQKLVTRQIASTTVFQYRFGPSWRTRMEWIDVDSVTGLRRR